MLRLHGGGRRVAAAAPAPAVAAALLAWPACAPDSGGRASCVVPAAGTIACKECTQAAQIASRCLRVVSFSQAFPCAEPVSAFQSLIVQLCFLVKETPQSCIYRLGRFVAACLQTSALIPLGRCSFLCFAAGVV